MKVVILMENSTCRDTVACAHGLSMYIETDKHKILFDMGPDAQFIDNAKALGQSAIDFKDILNALPALDRGFVEGNRILVHMHHLAPGIGKDHVQGNRGVLHPESHELRAFIDEKHPRAQRQVFPKHQALRALGGIVGHFDREPRLPPIAAKIHPVGRTGRKGGPCKSPEGQAKP